MSSRAESTPRLVRIRNRTELDAIAAKIRYRVQDVKAWTGDGHYYVRTYSQRCPKGCCYDSVIELTTPEDEATEIKDQMKELAARLREARQAKAI
jgi:hypothetical protein